jgi:hypothetical protein
VTQRGVLAFMSYTRPPVYDDYDYDDRPPYEPPPRRSARSWATPDTTRTNTDRGEPSMPYFAGRLRTFRAQASPAHGMPFWATVSAPHIAVAKEMFAAQYRGSRIGFPIEG